MSNFINGQAENLLKQIKGKIKKKFFKKLENVYFLKIISFEVYLQGRQPGKVSC